MKECDHRGALFGLCDGEDIVSGGVGGVGVSGGIQEELGHVSVVEHGGDDEGGLAVVVFGGFKVCAGGDEGFYGFGETHDDGGVKGFAIDRFAVGGSAGFEEDVDGGDIFL